MNMPLDKLEFKERPFEALGAGKFITFWDIVVNGKSLHDTLHSNYITPLSKKWNSDTTKDCLDRLLGNKEPDLAEHRIALYVCPECGDISDGVLSAQISFEPGLVVWKSFGWQDEDPDVELEKGIPDFRFDRADYESTLNAVAHSFPFRL